MNRVILVGLLALGACAVAAVVLLATPPPTQALRGDNAVGDTGVDPHSAFAPG